MGYSFVPMVPPMHDYVGMMIGIIAILVASAVLFVVVAANASTFKGFAVLGSILGVIASVAIALVAITTLRVAGTTLRQDTKPFPNKEVVGVFKGYLAESERINSGKHMVDSHQLYVIYTVPEGDVVLRAAPGQVYPQRAVLYKN